MKKPKNQKKVKKNQKKIENLTPKREKFCTEYIKDRNGKQAAIRSGYSEKTAENTASRLLRFVKVQARIKELEKIEEEEAGVSEEKTLEEAGILAHSDITDFLEVKQGHIEIDEGIIIESLVMSVKPSEKWPEKKRRAIQAVKQYPSGAIELKLHGKNQQLTNLFKHFKLFEEGSEDIPVSNLKEALSGKSVKRNMERL